jgi:hypothetical protein
MGNEYRGVIGIVQFPPRDGEANGKPVRNIRVNSFGFGPYAVPVDATLWPSHEDVEVAENDLVALEGKYNKTNKTVNGEPRTYHNISVTRFKNLGQVESGTKPDVDENATDAEPDDDIPF